MSPVAGKPSLDLACFAQFHAASGMARPETSSLQLHLASRHQNRPL